MRGGGEQQGGEAKGFFERDQKKENPTIDVAAPSFAATCGAALEQGFALHDEVGTILGGVHFELTGEDVTEVVGGARGLSEDDLHRAYESDVDPRLNHEQALELAFLIAAQLRKRRR